MSTQFQQGDRVSILGTITGVGDRWIHVSFDGAEDEFGFQPANQPALILVERAEPRYGSVVVKDGAAWTREPEGQPFGSHLWRKAGNEDIWKSWSDLSDGDVIFTPEAAE